MDLRGAKKLLWCKLAATWWEFSLFLPSFCDVEERGPNHWLVDDWPQYSFKKDSSRYWWRAQFVVACAQCTGWNDPRLATLRTQDDSPVWQRYTPPPPPPHPLQRCSLPPQNVAVATLPPSRTRASAPQSPSPKPSLCNVPFPPRPERFPCKVFPSPKRCCAKSPLPQPPTQWTHPKMFPWQRPRLRFVQSKNVPRDCAGWQQCEKVS